MRQIEIEGRRVGENQPIFVIAEAADSHLGSMERAFEMIREAKRAGADCIKFQHHLPDEEMLRDVPISDNFDEPLYDFIKRNALNIGQHAELKAYCKQMDIIYLCTPFSFAAAKELSSIGVRAFKIGSGEFTDLPSLERIAALGNPLLLSSGMCTMEEVRETYLAAKTWAVPFSFLNCVSEYPPRYEEMNIRVISLLKEEFPDIVIGHSDHTPDLYTSFAAVALGADIIEKHITLDKRLRGPDQSVSIDMKELASLVEGVRKIKKSLGREKKVHDREKQIREWAFRSIVTTRDVPPGTVLTQEMLWTKRPGTGIPSKELSNFVGRKTVNPLKANQLLRREDVA